MKKNSSFMFLYECFLKNLTLSHQGTFLLLFVGN
jgi:hypothetical protein